MVTRKSEANVMVKNMMDVTIGGLAYWFVGYGFSYGPNTKPSTAMSGEGFFLVDVDQNGPNAYVYVSFIFQLSFATAATTIVSGRNSKVLFKISETFFSDGNNFFNF